MKEYPSIPFHPPNGEYYYFFKKLDGQNIRVEYTKKRGFYKFGSRHQLLSESDEVFGKAFSIFKNTLADKLEFIIKKRKWQDPVTLFCEYWGDNSIGGFHKEGDSMYVTVIDINIYKNGFLDPKEFVDLDKQLSVDNKELVEFLGREKYNEVLKNSIYTNSFSVLLNEGVVGKRLYGNEIKRVKIKTNEWKEKIKALFDEEKAKELLRDTEF